MSHAFTEGNLKEAVTELLDERWLHSVPESIRCYVDYDSFARDCELGGDLTEFDVNNRTYTCTNVSGVWELKSASLNTGWFVG